MTADKILKSLEEDKYKFVDLRFCDTMGKEQHVSLPISAVDEDLFEEGKMFDGSSISGWKGINESDMVLMPDPDTGRERPVRRGQDADHPLRRARTEHHGRLQPLPTLAGEARRGLPEVQRHRRYGVFRART